MSSSQWGAPPPDHIQEQSLRPPEHRLPHSTSNNKQPNSHRQDGYGKPMFNLSEHSRPSFPSFMNQNSHSTQYQNQPTNVPPYNNFPRFPPPPPSASTAPPKPGVGHGFFPPSLPPSSFPSVPQPPSNQFGVSGQPPHTLPAPPFTQHPMYDGRDQPAANMMFNPSLPPHHPPHPPSHHHHPPHQPQQEWSKGPPSAGQGGHEQWDQRLVGNNFQPPSMEANAQNKFSSHPQQADRRNKHGNSNRTQPRLQPYQSFRSKQSERSHQSSFPAQTQMPPGGDGLHNANFEQNVSTEVDQPEKEESEDQKWVNEWSRSIKKEENLNKEARRPMVKIYEARIMLTRFLQLLDQLKKKKEEASDSLMKETDERKWFHLVKEMEKQAEDLSKLETRISKPEFVEGLKRKIEKRRKKRGRHQRHRQEEWEMREEAIRERNEKIDASIAEALQAKQEKEQEKVLQKEVDQVLSEVHRKKHDATKTMELFRALRKLRQLRKESAEKQVGYKAPRVLDERFEKKISSLEEMMNKQKLLYVEEERALQVMLEEELEETREKARQKKKLKERRKAEKAWEEQLDLLFGRTEELELGHPLFMFRQFHQQASHDLQSLTNIRRQWDTFIVPEVDPAGSSIPVSWVTPSDPANHIWATAMEESPDP